MCIYILVSIFRRVRAFGRKCEIDAMQEGVLNDSRLAVYQTVSIECRSSCLCQASVLYTMGYLRVSASYLSLLAFFLLSVFLFCFVLFCFSLYFCHYALVGASCRYSSDLFPVQQATNRIGNRAYYWIWLKLDWLMRTIHTGRSNRYGCNSCPWSAEQGLESESPPLLVRA